MRARRLTIAVSVITAPSMPLAVANARKSFVLLPVVGSNTSSGSGVLVVVGVSAVIIRCTSAP